jgi:hypothetical protein
VDPAAGLLHLAMRLTQAIGNGLVAGAVGTAAMTLSSTTEMKVRGREPSAVPPISGWGREEIAIDGLHHLVYATATSAACDRLEQAA